MHNNETIQVLLIEDSRGDVRLIREMLANVQDMHFDLHYADRLSTGLELLAQRDFDVILLDLSLPDSKGLYTFKTVQTYIPQMPIIVLTGLEDQAVATQAVEEGAQDYLFKGQVDSSMLGRAIRYAIGRKHAETALRESEERYRLLFNRGNDVIFVYRLTSEGLPGQFIEVNDVACQRLDYTRKTLLGMTPLDIEAPDSQRDVSDIMEELFVQRHVMFEVMHVTKEGDRIPVEVNAHLFDLRGEPTVLSIARDITRRKRVEAELRAALREKDVLLREVHHRVKNNLQVISSLMDLQSNYITNEKILRMFQESQNRIRSMALIHEKLYQSSGLMRIDFKAYLQNLTTHLFRSFGVSAYIINLTLDVEDVFLDLDTAVPCALIINELVSNALKYAFPDSWRQAQDKEAKLCITLREEADRLILVVKDNGVGLPAELDIKQTNSLGLRLVLMLARQLKATLDIERRDGTIFTLTFAMPGK